MKTERFIANRLTDPKETKGNLSRPFIKIATIAVALSLAVMIIAVAVITGFKNEISEKTIGFGSHIQILNYDRNISFETTPISSNQEFIPDLLSIDGVKHIQPFAVKPGIIKTDIDIQGVVLKGITKDFDWGFFKKNLKQGNILSLNDSTTSNSVVISKTLSLLLSLDVGDKFDMFFVQEPPRFRRFTVEGVYDSQMAEFDKLFVLCDLKHIQQLNGWEPDQVTGLEILISDFRKIQDLTLKVEDIVVFQFLSDGSRLRVLSIIEKYPQIFDWLGIQDLNVIILLVLMIAVAGINMISGLLIIILERTYMIGVLKALGAENRFVRNIFLIQSGHIIVRGLLWGNIIGVGLCLLQHYFGIIKLDEANYYLSTVPINLSALHVLMVNIGTFAVTITMLLIPSMVISRISPDKTIKFE
ncbi:MAG: ABC transporter permease [Bacteroidales bacterium]|nr:ABC transporter permease [Bacteroidales bacterium]MDY0198207.1 ABC transporter permease [Tenuifilaceae bacterium]